MGKTTYKRSVGRIGNPAAPSYFITLPRELINELGWTGARELQIKRSRGKLVIEA